MSMEREALLAQARQHEPRAEILAECDLPALSVPAETLEGFMRSLRDDPLLIFDMLMDLTAVDWLDDNRFELVYRLYSTKYGHDLLISTFIPREKPVAPSMTGVWTIAQWQEREVYDLFGIAYRGHPDLRRLFLEDDWVGHPLRKDYKDDFMLEHP
jgi:NADH-quinone oxidoreductase subunit C